MPRLAALLFLAGVAVAALHPRPRAQRPPFADMWPGDALMPTSYTAFFRFLCDEGPSEAIH